jgi:glucose/mannose-6-phosphate isomerase
MNQPAGTARLDDRAWIASVDASGMLAAIAGMGDQLERGFDAAARHQDLPGGELVSSVVVCGMGGSGIAGDVLQSLYADRSRVPIVVCKGYDLPEFVGRDTLLIALSFSGNTDETLHAFDHAVRVGARVIAVSAGGELAVRAGEEGAPRIAVPTDVEMPRAALGYLAAAPIGILEAAGLIAGASDAVAATAVGLRTRAADLAPDRPVSANPAKEIAAWIGDRVPLVWAPEGIGAAAALRWKNQLNENAKTPAFVGTLPELGHNEVEGWVDGSGGGFALIVLRPTHGRGWVDRRVAATLRAIEGSGLEAREVEAPGDGAMSRLFQLILLGDFVSAYLAILRGIDPTPVPILTRIKDEVRW